MLMSHARCTLVNVDVLTEERKLHFEKALGTCGELPSALSEVVGVPLRCFQDNWAETKECGTF